VVNRPVQPFAPGASSLAPFSFESSVDIDVLQDQSQHFAGASTPPLETAKHDVVKSVGTTQSSNDDLLDSPTEESFDGCLCSKLYRITVPAQSFSFAASLLDDLSIGADAKETMSAWATALLLEIVKHGALPDEIVLLWDAESDVLYWAFHTDEAKYGGCMCSDLYSVDLPILSFGFGAGSETEILHSILRLGLSLFGLKLDYHW